jgi:hypothetical protein
MATEKIVQMPQIDVVQNSTDLVLETLQVLAKQREEAQKMTRESLEKMNTLVRAAGQTALDLYDFNVRLTETWFAMSQDAVRNAAGMAKKVQAKAA